MTTAKIILACAALVLVLGVTITFAIVVVSSIRDTDNNDRPPKYKYHRREIYDRNTDYADWHGSDSCSRNPNRLSGADRR